jgi:hypothetical protein
LTLHSLKLCASHYSLRVPNTDPEMNEQIKTILEGSMQNVWWTKNTIRKSISYLPSRPDKSDWSQKVDGWAEKSFREAPSSRWISSSSSQTSERLPRTPSFSYLLITSLRKTKIATGAYLKLSPMLKGLSVSTFACLPEET